MKKAFTMIELVFVIVVVGILAAVILPRIDRNTLPEAIIELRSHIRYTQHLAMIDDKFDAKDAAWYINRWQMRFNGNSYSIVSDNGVTFASDPQTKEHIIIDLMDKYGVTLTSSCGNFVSFDYLGRPLFGDLNDTAKAYEFGSLATTKCEITLSNGNDDNQTLTILPETGYVY